jgi:hypothetical protein
MCICTITLVITLFQYIASIKCLQCFKQCTILIVLYCIVSDSCSDCFIPINCIFLLMIFNNLLRIRSIILGVLTQNLYQQCLLLFHQIQRIATNYIELKSNVSTRTNKPMPTCSLFCPLLPLQDYLLQGWYSSFSLYF